MASEELVTEQFQFLGIEVEKEVLAKCVSLCEEYDIDAETFSEQWMAFSLTHLNGALPNLENLDLLARKEFSKRASSRLIAPSKVVDRTSTGSGLTLYGASVPAPQSDNEIISNYITGTPKRIKEETETLTVQNELHPATYSPNVGHSAKYASRNNQGSIVHSYGDEKLLDIISKPNGPNDVINLNITQVPNDDGDLYTKSMFSFELLHEKAGIFDSHISYLSQCIMKKAGLHEATSVRHKSQTEVVVAGRIECDADARLNPKCVVLQGTWEESLSQAVPVDMDNLQQYSIYPGQVVLMRGVNPRGDRFVAHEVFHDGARPVPDHAADMMNTLRGTMSLVIASGPYTTSDNLSYEPLKDLVTYIAANRPHVVLMTGPFLDSEHSRVKDNSMAETFKSFFDKLIDSLGELSTVSPHTKIYVVSSSRDASNVNVYPTPAHASRRRHPNVHFLPDPATINVNGILLGVTSTDVLMHLSQEEISLGTGGDKLSRLSSHVLSQQSYYPLWPPPTAHCVDAALWAAHANLPASPHILILPSNFRYFVKEVNGTVVINPEHLSKGAGGGTFARVLVSCDDKGDKSIAAQIVRI